jgi:hypothetical protein
VGRPHRTGTKHAHSRHGDDTVALRHSYASRSEPYECLEEGAWDETHDPRYTGQRAELLLRLLLGGTDLIVYLAKRQLVRSWDAHQLGDGFATQFALT